MTTTPNSDERAAKPTITLDFKQVTELLKMFGGEPGEITLMTGPGHSGDGLYAYYSEYPEEGAEYFGKSDDEAVAEEVECANCNQLVRALREATEGPTFMGEPVIQAARTQPDMASQWRDISDGAPKDGTKVLLNWKSGIVVGWYEERTSRTHLSPWRRDLFGLRDTCYGAEPTHWQALPPAPAGVA